MSDLTPRPPDGLPPAATPADPDTPALRPADPAEDPRGELYVVVGGAGRIDCIHAGDGCPWANYGLFEDGFEGEALTAWSETFP